MKLHELAYFTDNIQGMADFYRSLLGAEPVAQSDDMAIFMSGGTKIFIHRNYPASEGDLPANNHIPVNELTCVVVILFHYWQDGYLPSFPV